MDEDFAVWCLENRTMLEKVRDQSARVLEWSPEKTVAAVLALWNVNRVRWVPFFLEHYGIPEPHGCIAKKEY